MIVGFPSSVGVGDGSVAELFSELLKFESSEVGVPAVEESLEPTPVDVPTPRLYPTSDGAMEAGSP
jgi:hypothetical protein